MFRKISTSQLDHKQFGVGSVATIGRDGKYLVISPSPSKVAVLDMSTFEILGTLYVVDDINHLTEQEARSLFGQSCFAAAFSDFDFDVIGLKR
jgi:hypothetical protein